MADHKQTATDATTESAPVKTGNGNHHEDDDTSTRIDTSKTQKIIETLEERSKGLKRNAGAALLMILVLLIGGGIMLYNIDEILGKQSVQLDITETSGRLGDIKSLVEEVSKQTISKDSKIAETNAILQRFAEKPVIGIEESFAKAREGRDRVAQLEAELESLRFKRDPSKQALEDNRDLLAVIERRLMGSKGGLKAEERLDELSDRLLSIKKFINDRETTLERLREKLDRRNVTEKEKDGPEIDIKRLGIDIQDARRAENEILREIDQANKVMLANKEDQTRAINRITEAQAKLSEINGDIAKREKLLVAEKASSAELTTGLNATRDQVKKMALDISGIRSTVGTLTVDNAKATNLIENAQTTLAAQISDWERELKALKAAADTGGETKIWSSLGTRAALIVILLFLVQILVTLYRYNMRLASFYDARIDALKLAGSSTIKELGELIMHLSPEQLDFGKTPATVTEQAFDLAKTLLNRDARKPGT